MKDGKITLRELHPSIRNKLNPKEIICNVEVKASDKASVLNQILYVKNLATDNVEEYSIISPIIAIKLLPGIEYEIWLNDKIDYVTPEKETMLTNKDCDLFLTYIKDEVQCNVSISCNNGESAVGQKLTVVNNNTQDSKVYILDSENMVLNLKSSTSYTFSLDEKLNYITPESTTITTNKIGVGSEVSMEYIIDEVNVNINVSFDDNTSVFNQILSIKNNKTQEINNININDNNTILKLKTNTSYTFSLDSKKGYITPDEQTITTGGLGSSNNINLEYLKDLANLIINVKCSDYNSVIGQTVYVQNTLTDNIQNYTLNNNILNLKVDSNTSYLIWVNDKNNYISPEKQTIEVKGFNSENTVDITYMLDEISCIITIECDDGLSPIGLNFNITNTKTEEINTINVQSNSITVKLKSLTEYRISSNESEYVFKEKVITTNEIGTISNLDILFLKNEVTLKINIINELETSEIGQTLSIKNVLTSDTKDIIISENPMNIKLKSNTEYHISIKNTSSGKTLGTETYITKTVLDEDQSINIKCQKLIIYGINIDGNNSDPNTAVTYTDDAIGFTPVTILNGITNYGSWENTFIFKGNRPCMLKNGVVNYYLNENDHALKEDGEPADIISGNDGDCMVEFQQTWYKMYNEGDISKFKIANYKVDDTYCSNAFISDKDPTQFGPMYYGMYDGSILNNALRSLSNVSPKVSFNINEFRVSAVLNGKGYQQITFHKWVYILFLTFLVGKTINVASFSKGSNSTLLKTGILKNKGRFYNDTNTNECKIFFIENLWGNLYEFIDGIYLLQNKAYYKLYGPYARELSEITKSYSSGLSLNSGNISGRISKLYIDNDYGVLPKEFKGSTTTYYNSYFECSDSSQQPIMFGNSYNSYYGSMLTMFCNTAGNGHINRGSRLTFS